MNLTKHNYLDMYFQYKLDFENFYLDSYIEVISKDPFVKCFEEN
jgi:hypothetical protein